MTTCLGDATADIDMEPEFRNGGEGSPMNKRLQN